MENASFVNVRRYHLNKCTKCGAPVDADGIHYVTEGKDTKPWTDGEIQTAEYASMLKSLGLI